jgi:threonine-phosphate decarboxylase
MVLSSVSKIFAIPGLRIGFVISHAEIIKKFKRFLQPWSVNSLAQLAVRHLTTIKNDADTFIEKTQRYIRTERRRFFDAAKDFPGIQLFPSTTNFMLAELPYDLQAEDVINQLARDKILLRNCHNFQGLSSRYVRISLKTPEANQLMAEKLSAMVRKTTVEPKKPEAKIRITG